jgi:hypothetical protein
MVDLIANEAAIVDEIEVVPLISRELLTHFGTVKLGGWNQGRVLSICTKRNQIVREGTRHDIQFNGERHEGLPIHINQERVVGCT